MRAFVDTYLLNLVLQSMNSKAELPPKFFSDAKRLGETIPSLQTRTEDVCKLLVDADHVKTIVSVDAEADGKSRGDRIAYLQSLNPSPKYTLVHRTALECVLVSELLLAMGDLSVEQVVYHRARTFAYSLIFMLKETLMPMLLLAGLAQTCQFALAAVILDDAEDYEEDRRAESPTLFTRATKDEAIKRSLGVLAHLDGMHTSESVLKFLDTREFLLLACLKVQEFGGSPQPGIDTKLLLRRLAREHWSDTWRGI